MSILFQVDIFSPREDCAVCCIKAAICQIFSSLLSAVLFFFFSKSIFSSSFFVLLLPRYRKLKGKICHLCLIRFSLIKVFNDSC